MYVLIGATGNTGSVAANALLDKGEKVRVVGRSASRLEKFTKRGAEAAVVDIADPDATALVKACSGAKALYAMIPPDTSSSDILAYDGVVTKVIATALQTAAISHVVILSSFGADKAAKTGPVVGLHRLEEMISTIAGVNALFLRPGYFMENLLPQIGILKNFGMLAGPLRADLAVPMIATRDIGAYAAERMLKLDFQGTQTQELLGQRDVTYAEVAQVIGSALGNSLAYQQLPNEQVAAALLQMGMSENAAGLLLEMSEALNSGYMAPLEKRSAANTTPTSIEQFVRETFVPAYAA